MYIKLNGPATPRPEDGLSLLLPEELSNDGDKTLRRLSQMLLRPEASFGLMPKGSNVETSELNRNSLISKQCKVKRQNINI